MAASKTLKSADRQNIIKKLTAELKKRYKGHAPKSVRSVMETLIFALCLEDSSFEDAEHAFQQLLDSFFDLNEIRVSSVDEIKRALGPLRANDWKAFRLREALQDVFEKHFSFDLDGLKRKTLDAAQKELGGIPQQTLFAISYTLQTCCGAHIVPVDETMFAALLWLGLTEPNSTPQQAADELKSAIKKADAAGFCYLLKELAVDPKLAAAFCDAPDDDTDPNDATKRLISLIKNGPPKPSPKKAVPKPAPKVAVTQPKVTKPVAIVSKPKPVAKPAAPQKKVVKKKPAAKPASVKKPTAKPASTAKKVTKKKPVKKTPAGKTRKR